MNNRLKEKLLDGQPLAVADLTPDQKKSLYSFLVSRGASEGFGYDRFFKVGFSKWELTGIDEIKRQFLKDNLDALQAVENDNIHMLRSETVQDAIIDTIGGFWALINQVKGLQQKLVDLMSAQGMCRTSVLNHFLADDWRTFQRQGILKVWAEFCEQEGIDG